MPKYRKLNEPRGWGFGTGVAVVKPLLLTFTRRRWIDGEKIPASGGCVLVANHISHLDPLTFAHFVYEHGRIPRFLAKAEVFDVPFVGAVVRDAKQIPVTRLTADAARAYDAAVAAVESGECVVVYPEGTITREPGLWPMKGRTGAARIALRTGVPVVPVAQWGVQDVLAPYAKRPHLIPPRTITAQAGDPVPLEDLRATAQSAEVLAEATERIMAAITSLLEEIRGEKAPPERFDPRAAGVRRTGNPHKQTRSSRRKEA